MSIADELQKLEDLRRAGSLTEEEFAQAKAAVLAGSSGAPAEPIGHHLSDQLAEVRYQNALAQIDREWAQEKQQYIIMSRYGWQQVPTSGMAIGIAAVGGIFGLLWTVMAIAITGSAPDVGLFAIARIVFPLFGVVFIVTAIGCGIYCGNRAKAYQKAFAAYQSRRRAIRAE
jgi:hypothetical protein